MGRFWPKLLVVWPPWIYCELTATIHRPPTKNVHASVLASDPHVSPSSSKSRNIPYFPAVRLTSSENAAIRQIKLSWAPCTWSTGDYHNEEFTCASSSADNGGRFCSAGPGMDSSYGESVMCTVHCCIVQITTFLIFSHICKVFYLLFYLQITDIKSKKHCDLIFIIKQIVEKNCETKSVFFFVKNLDKGAKKSIWTKNYEMFCKN